MKRVSLRRQLLEREVRGRGLGHQNQSLRHLELFLQFQSKIFATSREGMVMTDFENEQSMADELHRQWISPDWMRDGKSTGASHRPLAAFSSDQSAPKYTEAVF
jgi:hypothetical protein